MNSDKEKVYKQMLRVLERIKYEDGLPTSTTSLDYRTLEAVELVLEAAADIDPSPPAA